MGRYGESFLKTPSVPPSRPAQFHYEMLARKSYEFSETKSTHQSPGGKLERESEVNKSYDSVEVGKLEKSKR